MKKILAMLLALCLVFAFFAGCSSNGDSSDDATSPSADASDDTTPDGGDEETPTVEVKDVKIGVIMYNLEDQINIRRMASWEYFAEQNGHVEVTFQVAASDIEEQISAVENLILQGCDGIVLMSYDAIDQVSQLCDDAGIYYMLITTDIYDDDIWAQTCESEYFLGSCNYAPYDEAVAQAEWALEQGYREGILIGATEGKIAFEGAICDGITDTIEAWNEANPDDQFTLHDYRTQHAMMADTTAAAITAHPNAEVIFSTQSGTKYCYPQIAAANKLGQIKLVTWTLNGNEADAFADGTLAYILPNADDTAFAFMLMYNALQGVPMADEAVKLAPRLVRLMSNEDLDVYNEKYGDNEYQVITYEYMEQFDKTINPDVTAEDMQAAMDTYSMETILDGTFGG